MKHDCPHEADAEGRRSCPASTPVLPGTVGPAAGSGSLPRYRIPGSEKELRERRAHLQAQIGGPSLPKPVPGPAVSSPPMPVGGGFAPGPGVRPPEGTPGGPAHAPVPTASSPPAWTPPSGGLPQMPGTRPLQEQRERRTHLQTQTSPIRSGTPAPVLVGPGGTSPVTRAVSGVVSPASRSAMAGRGYSLSSIDRKALGLAAVAFARIAASTGSLP